MKIFELLCAGVALTLSACDLPSQPPSAQSGDDGASGANSDTAPSADPPLALPIRQSLGSVTPLGATVAPLIYHGGRVLGHVDIVPVFWGNSVNATTKARIPAFYDSIVNSVHMDWLKEYNTPATGGTNQSIGRGTARAPYTITAGRSSLSITDADIRAELAAQIDAHVLPAPGADTIYMVHFPAGMTISTGNGASSCIDFCAYHYSFTHNSARVTYGVMPDLGPGTGCEGICGGGTQFDNTCYASSHELVEAIVDPDVGSGWVNAAGAEIGDICNQQEAPLPGTGFIVQPEWSNRAAACVVVGPQTSPVYTPGDFNGDGLTDLVVSTRTGSYWYFANGTGGWTTPYTRADLPISAVSYTPGDFNGDGRTDLVITTATGSGWYFSNGDGTWNMRYSRGDLTIGAVMYTPGDFNHDGRTDLVITTASGSFWYFSNGDGTWNVPFNRTDLPINTVGYVPGDFNGDGNTDLVITTATGSYWYFSNGNGTWNMAYSRPELSLGAVEYVTGDFNGDRNTDLVITTRTGSYWYFSNGNGTWSIPYSRTDLSKGAVRYVSGDFNGDGRTDLVVLTLSGSYWYFADGSGGWTYPYSRADLPMGSVHYLPARFDANAMTDLVVTVASGSYWYFSNGNGTWHVPYLRSDLAL